MLALLPQTAPPNPPTLAIDGFVVGARIGNVWRPVDIKQGWARRPATAFREIGVTRLGRSIQAKFTDEEVPQGVYLDPSVTVREGILVAGATPRVPRRAVEIPANSATYARTLREFLDAKGLRRAKPRVRRIVSVDLDGDGTKEVLIEARSAEDLDRRSLTASFGHSDYSFVLLRAIHNGRVVTIPIGDAGGPKGDGLLHKLRAIADLDGDGRMEIVTSYTAWEAFGGTLYSYRTGKATKLVQSGSGF